MFVKFRWVSGLMALAGVVFLWYHMSIGDLPPHGPMSMLLLAMALCVVHAVGWQVKTTWERYLFYPPLAWVLWLLALYLSS
ncbi:cyd operon YbgE family protein [Gallaecimonas mangrovi]|uniref:cyd operon YbgE family protein n=1 Tax=Gallaecimonas mangrovi TaxID=2291597 RepID=UPI000E202C87|nr:cyd operon YbgE family protein [Gallaecimonas mangrovi]